MTSTMNLYDKVVIAYDKNLENFQMAIAIRGMLEFYGLKVSLVWLNEKQNAIDFLAGQFPKADYTILCAHGIGHENRIWLTVIEKMAGTDCCYEEVEFNLTPDNIAEYVKNSGGTFMTTACESGSEEFAKAFLDAGYQAFIAPEVAVDIISSVMFICGFFCNMLAHERDIHKATYTEGEAVERAAAIQPFPDGTAAFRYFSRDHNGCSAV
jgi:hypothetical protein